ncbi:hypothetical protein GGX14DRAFT_419682 [Mycena pura]|uniref:Beta-glucuronidase C-terminal domain-containing protein n=1 Tax=Mycena pura TaxID=153505 RepID=A0AAD7E465_9AGAR|nr:hypothetical protein GGX14DRAFT_419682 [Mycena pura]
MLANVSSLLNVQWYLGIPLNDTTNLRLAIAEFGEAILGDSVIGYQVGNEPDEYAKHDKRPPTYDQADYSREFGIVDAALRADPNVPVVDGKLLGPSVSGPWTPQSVWDVGFLTDHHESLAAISMMRYPHTSCSSPGKQRDPQDLFPSYLNHTASQIIVADYLSSTALAQTYNLPFVMIETNTASCGGFPGISNSFGGAIFLLDYALQMASSNFTNAMLHVSGQGVYYNPFTPPPTNQTSFRNWTVGAPYYAVLAVAETFGKSNKSQIIDLQTNDNNIFTPGYAIYDAGVLSRLALFNYVTDPSGLNDYTMSFAIGGGTTGQANGTPAQVKVKYLLAPSVSVKDNITWAGQTFGTAFESVGRPTGTEQIQTVNCNSDNTCDVKVPAPGFALVFLDENNPPFSEDVQVFTATSTAGQAAKTFNTLVIDPAVVATANGQPGTNYLQAGTSPGKRPNGARAAQSVPCIVVAVCMAIGVVRVLGGVV